MNAERTTLAYLFGLLGRFRFCGVVTQFVQIRYLPILLGAQLQLTYGIVIFAYMSGTLIGILQRDINRGKPAAYIFAVDACSVAFAVMVFVPQHLHLALVVGSRCYY